MRRQREEILEKGICTKCDINPMSRTKPPYWCNTCFNSYQKQYYANNKIGDTRHYGNKPFEAKYNLYRKNAENRNYVFELTLHDFTDLMQGTCYYCGTNKHIGVYRYDNSVGYILDNTVSCCKHCNYAKRTLTPDEFYAWLDRIATYNGYTKA